MSDEEKLAAEIEALARTASAGLTPFLRPGVEHAGLRLLDVEAAADRLEVQPRDVPILAASGNLLAIDIEGELAIPEFQLDPSRSDGMSELVVAIINCLNPVCADKRTLLAWFLAPKEELGARRPADCVGDTEESELVLMAARRDAARLR